MEEKINKMIELLIEIRNEQIKVREEKEKSDNKCKKALDFFRDNEKVYGIKSSND